MTAEMPAVGGWLSGLSLAGRLKADPLGVSLELHRQARDAGAPAILVRMGPVRSWWLVDPALIRDVMTGRKHAIRKLERFREAFRVVDGEGLVVSEGPLWKRQRRLIQQSFVPARLRSYVAVMTARVAAHVERWQDGDAFEVDETTTRMTQDVAARLLLGVEVEEDARALGDAIADFSEVVTDELGQAFAWPDWLPTQSKRRKRDAVTTLRGFIDRAVDARLAAPEETWPDDVLSALIRARDDEGDGEAMADRLVRDEAMTLFNAGHDTTASALCWLLVLLAERPELQDALRDEVARVLGDDPADFARCKELALAGQVVAETLRMYPPAWALFPRIVDDAAAVAEVLPGARRGDWLQIYPWALHRDPTLYPEPERFDPQRFDKGTSARHPAAFIPFGIGPHLCVGMQFAELEMTIVVAETVRRWRLERADERLLEPHATFSLRPRGGALLRARRR